MQNLLDYTTKCEEDYEKQIKKAADEAILQNKKFILLAGASCSGKTTTSKKLANELAFRGKKAETLSLDDFYIDADKINITYDGNPDYETPKRLDMDLFNRVFAELELKKGIVEAPIFSFETKKRIEETNKIEMTDDTFLIIEGIHGLNPDVTGNVNNAYRIYLQCEGGSCDPKLIRRLVRDANHREAPAELTFSLWKNVKRGEALYILPYVDKADIVVNSFFEYETRAMRDEAYEVLSCVKAESSYFGEAEKIIKIIKDLTDIPNEYIPENSLIWEFIGV